MKRSLDHYLSVLKEYDPLTEDRHAALEARIRHDIIARYGDLTIPARQVVHTPEVSVGGMLIYFFRSMARPALAFAAVGALAVGAVAVVWRITRPITTQAPSVVPSLPPSVVVASAAPVGPGSGAAVSVFGVEDRSQRIEVRSGASVIRRVRRIGKPLTPAEGVFTQWGTSVFSEEGLLQNGREGKNVFNS